MMKQKAKPRAKRRLIRPSVRFEVFKRDGFKCQYCGRSAPGTILHVDHIKAVSKGGDNDLINLITSCADCNGGKSARDLDDDSAIAKQRAQLEELNVRREQLEMLLKWREGLKGIGDDQVDAIAKEWSSHAIGWRLNDSGMLQAKKLLRRYPLADILDAIETAADQYFRYNDGDLDGDSVQAAWRKVAGILHVRSQPADRRAIHYIRGILRNRGLYINDSAYRELMEAAIAQCIDMDQLKDLAKTERNWTRFYGQASALVFGEA